VRLGTEDERLWSPIGRFEDDVAVRRLDGFATHAARDELLLRAFRGYGLLVCHTRVGRVVYATRLTTTQRNILYRLGFATPAQILARKLRAPPAA